MLDADPGSKKPAPAMKIYVLLMLIGVIVSFSYIPLRRAKAVSVPSSDSIPSEI